MHRRKVITKLINNNNYKSYVEIGTWRCKTTEYIIRHCPSLKRVIGIDPLKEKYNDFEGYTCLMGGDLKSDSELDRMYHQILKRFEKYDKFKFIRKTSVNASKDIEDESIDLVFIDAIHLYKYVKEDINLWIKKVKPGGIISGHDYGERFSEVKKAVDEYFGEENINVEVDNIWWILKK